MVENCGGAELKKKIVLGFLCLILILGCVMVPFWMFSFLVLPVMFFADLCNILLPVIALSVFGLSISAYFTKNYVRFNNVVGFLTLVMLVTLMNLFIEAIKLPVVAIIFMLPILSGYLIYKRNDVRYYLLIFPIVILVIIPIMYLWFKAVV